MAVNLQCPPYREIIFEDGGATSSEEKVMRSWVTENWPSIWPKIQSELEELVESVSGNRDLDAFQQRTDSALAIHFTKDPSDPIADEVDYNWMMTGEVESSSGCMGFFMCLADRAVVESQAIH